MMALSVFLADSFTLYLKGYDPKHKCAKTISSRYLGRCWLLVSFRNHHFLRVIMVLRLFLSVTRIIGKREILRLSILNEFLNQFRVLSCRNFQSISITICALVFGANLAFAADDTSQKAVDYFKAGRYEEACPLFERLVERNSNDIRAQYYLAIVCQKLGQNSRASFLFEKIVATAPTSAEARLSKQALSSASQGGGAATKEHSNISGSSNTASTASIPSTSSTASIPSTSSSVPRVDEIDYWRKVKSVVPENALPAALLLKPKYRADFLSGRTTVDTITNADYTSSQREIDSRWIQRFQSQESSFRPVKNITVAGYDINQFVGYKIGNLPRFFDSDGLCYKVFFEFRDASVDLTPDLYMQFSSALSDAGFVGDSKIGMKPGYSRFNYNNIIVHTSSPEMGKVAEQVGLNLFGSKLAHSGRGLDVMQNKVDGRFSDPADWHHFLAHASDLSRLSARASAYVNFSD